MENHIYYKELSFSDHIYKKEIIKSSVFNNCYKIEISKPKAILMLKELKFEDENDFINEIKNIKSKMLLTNDHILKLIDYSSGIQKSFCSKIYWINIFYEYPVKTIKELINKIIFQNSFFGEEDLTHLLYQQISANLHLQNKNMYHGKICPEYIGIFENEGLTKLIDCLEFENKNKNSIILNKRRYFQNKNLYISPFMFSLINNKTKLLSYNKYKEDVFSLGLVILECGILHNIQDIYIRETGKFDFDRLEYYLKRFGKRYINNTNYEYNLFNFLKQMLNYNEKERPDFKELLNKLPSYEQVIKYYKEISIFNNSKSIIMNDFSKFQKDYKPSTLTYLDNDEIKKYENDSNYKIYYDEEYERYYYYNIINKECNWIYDKEELKKITNN